MTLADLTAVLSEVGRKHPDLVTDEKVRRYILLLVEEGRTINAATQSGPHMPPDSQRPL